jgi:RNA polymerase sigma factor (sigma-70 family)
MVRRRPDGFETFYLTTRDRCFRAVLASVGDPHEADDLVSEAYSRALAKWAEVCAHPAPAAWVTLTALNVHRDRWRRHKRRRPDEAASFVLDNDAPLDPVLVAAIRTLPNRQREVLVFRVLLELSAEQTAALLDIEPGTVGTHLRRALTQLRTVTETVADAQPDPTTESTRR